MKDFIFGSLSTDELRHNRVLSERSGINHNHQRSPRDPFPMQPVRVHLSVGPAHTGDQAWLYWTVDGSEPLGHHGTASNGFSIPLVSQGFQWDTELWGYIHIFNGLIPGQPDGTIVRYYMSLDDPLKGEIQADNGNSSAFFVANDPTPTWVSEAIIYHIFVDRFNPGKGHAWKHPATPSGFYGGRIKGISEKLDYIQELGFNTLWLSPIFPSPSHHGYDATDLFSIETRLGTLEDFLDLLQSCHNRGIRVLLDFVPNHISHEYPIFQSALRDINSPYHDWFTFHHWPDQYETFFGVQSLPQVNLKNPEARQYMIDAAIYWLKLGVDGFRLDYAIGPAQEFWAYFRKLTREVAPLCWTFGEAIDPPTDQLAFDGLMDGCLDFNLLEAIRQTIAFETWDVAHFSSFLTRHERFFPPTFSRPSFLDNHDMNRFLWASNGYAQKLRLAALCQFSLSGQPIVYYGTEVGLSQLRDIRQGTLGIPEEARLPMLWGKQQDKSLLDFYTNLISFRKSHPALGSSDRRPILIDDQLLVYWKQNILVILNIGPKSKTFKLPHPTLKLGLAASEIHWKSGNEIQLDGWSGAIFY